MGRDRGDVTRWSRGPKCCWPPIWCSRTKRPINSPYRLPPSERAGGGEPAGGPAGAPPLLPQASPLDLELEDASEQICVGDHIACYVELKRKKQESATAITRLFAMVVCEVVQGYGPSGRQARVPTVNPDMEDETEDGGGNGYAVDVRILVLSRAKRGKLVWQTGGNSYGQDIKSIPIEDVVLVRVVSVGGIEGGGKPKYAFNVKELQEAADR